MRTNRLQVFPTISVKRQLPQQIQQRNFPLGEDMFVFELDEDSFVVVT